MRVTRRPRCSIGAAQTCEISTPSRWRRATWHFENQDFSTQDKYIFLELQRNSLPSSFHSVVFLLCNFLSSFRCVVSLLSELFGLSIRYARPNRVAAYPFANSRQNKRFVDINYVAGLFGYLPPSEHYTYLLLRCLRRLLAENHE